MKLKILAAAQQELLEAADYYRAMDPALGDAFRQESKLAIQRMIAFPSAWHALSADLRRCQLNRFPYALIYTATASEILVLAVAHLHRSPGYWHNRINEP